MNEYYSKIRRGLVVIIVIADVIVVVIVHFLFDAVVFTIVVFVGFELLFLQNPWKYLTILRVGPGYDV